jgi:AcrR family transcriptional regulator
MAVQEIVAPRLRRDAARSRERVIVAGRAALKAGQTLQLNDIARAAGVGVGTVYRHFPTTTELLETLVADKFDTLIVEARSASTLDNPGEALEAFLAVALRLQVKDAGFAAVVAANTEALPSTTALKVTLGRVFGRIVERARDAGAIRPDIHGTDLRVLLCGLAYSARLSGTDKATHALFFESFMRGIRA